MPLAEYSLHGDIAVIRFNNPPMNTLALAMRTEVYELLETAIADPAVKAIVVTGGGRAYCSGAEIREFNTPKTTTFPMSRDLIAAFEESLKPVIAAIHGVAMGGGLENAMGCHYRVALAGAQLALPEVKLGILPGAGGTQRLPRAVGAEKALEMIVTGNPVKSESVAGTLLIDEIIEGDLLAGALAFAARVVAEKRPLRRLRDLAVPLDDADAFFAAARERVANEYRGYPAPLKCVEAVEAAVRLPMDEGLKAERRCFDELVVTTESKALRHAFFGERAVSKIPDIPDDMKGSEIRSAAIVGAGTMGGGIAMSFANAGLTVTLLDTTQEALDRGMATVRKNYAGTVTRGRLSQIEMDKRLGRISPTLEWHDLASADIVIEAVFEDMEVKKTVFGKLDAIARDGAVLASNTSHLDLDEIAAVTQRPASVIGTHFFSPANVMRLLEVVRGAKTSREVLATTLTLAKKLGKLGVVAGVCDGFIGNRMLEAYLQQAYLLLDEGVLPAQIDGALEAWGFAMGPFAMSDLSGNDIILATRKRRREENPENPQSAAPDRLCELGRFGQKTGAGWYRYETGKRTPLNDPAVDALLAEHRKAIGVPARKVSDEEIIERCVIALANEGARILEDGIALRSVDIDMVYLTGYGFPRYRGGPMFWIDNFGLAKAIDRIKTFGKGYMGNCWSVAPLLEQLATAQGTFTQWKGKS